MHLFILHILQCGHDQLLVFVAALQQKYVGDFESGECHNHVPP